MTQCEKIYGESVDRLNQLVWLYPQLHELTLDQLEAGAFNIPPAATSAVQGYAGAILNHEFYFDSVCPPGERVSFGALDREIVKNYGSMEAFMELFRQAAHTLSGAGWVWLAFDGDRLRIATTPDNRTLARQLSPVLVADLWEHAYLFISGTDKNDYVQRYFQAVNWQRAEQNFMDALHSRGQNRFP